MMILNVQIIEVFESGQLFEKDHVKFEGKRKKEIQSEEFSENEDEMNWKKSKFEVKKGYEPEKECKF